MFAILNDKQNKLFKKAKDFAENYIVPNAEKWEEEAKLPQELVEKLREAGFLGMMNPKSMGGSEMSYLDSVMVVEGIAYGDGGAAFFTELMNCVNYDLAVLYPENESVEGVINDITLCKKQTCFCFTEKDAGTDPFLAETTAVETDGGFIINGEKTWASNCADADYLLVWTKADNHKMFLFFVDAKAEGVKITEIRKRLGGNLISSGTVAFENVFVPAECLISTDAYDLAMHTINIARIYVSAMAVGFAGRALEITTEFLKERKTFGKPVMKNQYVQFKLADLAMKTEAARCLLYNTVALLDKGDLDISKAAPKVKLFCPETAWEVTSECAHLFGGIGCEVNKEITRLMGNASATRIEDGTSEVQRILIAKDL